VVTVDSTKPDSAHRSAWRLVGAAAVLASALVLIAPSAFAQSSGAKSEAKRYAEELSDTFNYVLQNFVDQPEAAAVFEGAMKGMLDSLGDAWSTYLDEAAMRDLRGITTGGYAGIGAYISKQAKDPAKGDDQALYIEIITPMEGTPAWRQGLMPGDLITKIDGEGTAPFSSSDAQKRLMGQAGTAVVLTIKRGDEPEFDATIVRAQVEIPAVKSALIPTQAGNVAYLRILDFTLAAKARVYEAIRDFDSKGYTGMIVDLRNNPGGLLISAVDIADAFLDAGVIVSTMGRDPLDDSVDKAKPDLAVPKDKPVVLLINKGSASSSEILAGALKDNKRAYVVGENSYGKGSVQQVFGFDAVGYKLTTARYYTPSGENIDKTGIPPDLEAKDPDLTDAQAAAATKLLATGKIAAFAKANPSADAAKRNAFADSLAKEGYDLPTRILRILVANELGRTRIPPVYDLEFDTALNAALAVIANPKYSQLLASAKTVREIVEARKAAMGAPADPKKADARAAAGAALPSPEIKN
jgi:carboxyl-terminal processing protease